MEKIIFRIFFLDVVVLHVHKIHCILPGQFSINFRGFTPPTNQCRECGIRCYENALIEVEGDQTKVDGNVTGGNSSSYGLHTYDYYDTSSTIRLLFPLTKESVSTNNGGGGNYGIFRRGTIETVDSFQ